jgi:hypothetical protein
MEATSTAFSNSSTAGLVAQPAYRRFLSDLTDERGVIPRALLRYPELAALEEQRQRLVAALAEAKRPSGPPQMSDDEYVAARAKALRDGTELPSPPPPQAAHDEYKRRSARDAKAAETALLALADEICDVLRAHPEWEQEGRAQIGTLHEQAEQKRREAEQAERDAERANFLVQWLSRGARDELYVVTSPT